jgi:hypothetical protein
MNASSPVDAAARRMSPKAAQKPYLADRFSVPWQSALRGAEAALPGTAERDASNSNAPTPFTPGDRCADCIFSWL